jgi:[protein-PII] uridylyltransferase
MASSRPKPSFSPNDPIADPREVEAFLRGLPIAVDRGEFLGLVLGFPRRYLERTPAAEVVRHYALVRSLGARGVVSTLSRQAGGWRLWVLARDRSYLFSRIAGALSCSGLSIAAAEAFTNANALVLDSFECVDPKGSLEGPDAPRQFQRFLERVICGSEDVEPLLEPRLPGLKLPPGTELRASWDDDSHPMATRLSLSAPDRFGLLYLVTRALSHASCNIEMAEVATPDGCALDAFYLTRDAARLRESDRRAIEQAFADLIAPASA